VDLLKSRIISSLLLVVSVFSHVTIYNLDKYF
jgi:hypothetical protein